jgi:molybdopterin-biosynthesis enzyme MoeA-like protein
LCLPHIPHIPHISHLLSHLVSEVMKLKKPTAMVLFNGGAMSLGPLKDSLSAIVAANYGGEMGAIALADVLFGHHNPTAKLAATW